MSTSTVSPAESSFRAPTALLEASGITKHFAGITALDGVDLDVNHGEMVGLIGPNGAGKTTLFNCMLGMLRPDVGSVYFDGRDVSGMPVYKRARAGIGRTFQRLELFAGMTVRDHFLVTERRRNGIRAPLEGPRQPFEAERGRGHAGRPHGRSPRAPRRGRQAR